MSTVMTFVQQLMTRRLVQQILRFAVVGGLAFVIDFGLLLFLTEFMGINYLISATISFTVSVIFNYILSVCWVFTKHREARAQYSRTWRLIQMVIFIVLSVCGLFINNFIMWFSVEVLAISYIIGKLVATAVVMVFNFITRKILLEGSKARQAAAAAAAAAATVAADQAATPAAEHTTSSDK